MNHKVCVDCKENKNLKEFYKKDGGRLGTRAECKSCGKKRDKLYFKRRSKKTIEKRKKYQYNYYHNNKEKFKERRAQYMKAYQKTANGKYTEYKAGAKKRGVDFNLTKEEFLNLWQNPCAYCKSELNTIGIDRINNKLGYHADNIISCCSICNVMKGSMSIEQFKLQIIRLSSNIKHWSV